MIGVILAAGMARRLRPLTDNMPKCLLTINGRTLLERTVDAMRQAGISEFVVVTGYHAEMVKVRLEEYASTTDVTFHFIDNTDFEHNNNIYSLWLAGEVVEGKDFLLMDSDILCEPSAVVCISRQKESALAVNRHELGDEEVKVIVDEDGNITEISKVCDPKTAVGESVGIERITASYSKALYAELKEMIEKEGLINVFYEQAFERLVHKGYTFKMVDTTEFFSFEIDTVEDYHYAQTISI